MLIIVAIDGSEAAGVGVDLVASATWPAGTTVRLIQAIDPTPVALMDPYGTVGLTHSDAELEVAGTANLEATAARLAKADLIVEHALVHGRPASVIVENARDSAADLVVMGSRGHGTIERMLLGSVSAEVVAHSPVPVLVARGPRTDRVVLGFDGSECAEHAARVLAKLPIATASVTVLGVAQPDLPWWSGISGPGAPAVMPAYARAARASQQDHERLAKTMAATLRDAGMAADAELRIGDPAEQIIEAAKERAADLIVVGTHGRTGLAGLLMGSVARNVVQHATCSVLVVH